MELQNKGGLGKSGKSLKPSLNVEFQSLDSRLCKFQGVSEASISDRNQARDLPKQERYEIQ